MEVYDFIQSGDRVVDIGSGQRPHERADVLVDKYPNENKERGKDFILPEGKVFVEADIEKMPFEDKEFDFAICNQVLEHTLDPAQACDELTRIAKRGFFSTPTALWEKLFGRTYHKWILWEEGDTTVFKKKPKDYSVSDKVLPCDQWYAEWQDFKKVIDQNWQSFYIQKPWEGTFKYRIETGRVPSSLYAWDALPKDMQELIKNNKERFIKGGLWKKELS